jgi:aldose 1-epimerase
MEARITNFGAILVSLKAPDRAGNLAGVVLGFNTFEEYYQAKSYYGATVRRFANRVAGGTYTLDGLTYTLAKNSGGSSMHGGLRGFNKVTWHEVSAGPSALELAYRSKDGEEGFPATWTSG